MQLWIGIDEDDIAAVRKVLDSARIAAGLGHPVEVKFERHGLIFEVGEEAIPLRQCAQDPSYKVRDSRQTLCYHGGDDDGHPLEPCIK